jgi:hypothetical protein
MKHRANSLRGAAFACAVALSMCFGTAHAQQLKKGTLSGTLVSATAPAGNSYLDVYTTPMDKAFVLTQACGCWTCRTGTFGPFAAASGTEPCATYVPGLALPRGETIQCTGDGACTLTGVLSLR